MATGTNGIATVSDLVNGKGLSNPQNLLQALCPTRIQIESMGGIVSGSYSHNQLVKYSDVTKATVTYTLIIHTYYNSYYAIALFPNVGTPSVSYSYYTFLQNFSPNYYMTTFSQGAALRVNSIQGSPQYVSIGNTYTVWGLLTSSSNWTKIATLTHVDQNISHLV